ncbi:MAG: dihydroorotase [Spirochaetaceae bacterium]|nr:MAG: dihydroorotase [Spirochaetaceae bacterium]
MRLVDPHVHLRDWKQAHKETIARALQVARCLGIGALFEMPNTDPPLTTREIVLQRIAHADRARSRDQAWSGEQVRTGARTGVKARPGVRPGAPPFHGLYVGLTDDPDQVRAAARLRDEFFPRVVGCKLYAGHSTGRMGVVTVAAQFQVWRALGDAAYRGVVAVHAEREDLLRPDLRDPADPLTHGAGRPPLAEIASVQTQIALAEAAGFRGTLHICHVSTPEALEIIRRERAGLPFRLTAGVTPHHLLLDREHAADAGPSEGAPAPAPPGTGFTVNPPLRDRAMRRRLWEMVLAGDADWIESDHAPHTWEEKIGGAAGLPGLPAFRRLAGELALPMDPSAIRRMTGEGVLETFGIDPGLVPEYPDIPEPPELPPEFEDATARYPWDPYHGIVPESRAPDG